MTDTFIDGCGVVKDQPLPEGTRLRLCPTEDPSEDVTVFVFDGAVHLVGQYSPLDSCPTARNRVAVWPVKIGA